MKHLKASEAERQRKSRQATQTSDTWELIHSVCSNINSSDIRGNTFISASPCGLESDGGLLPEPLPLTPALLLLWGALPARFRQACTLGDSLRFLAGLLPRAAGQTHRHRERRGGGLLNTRASQHLVRDQQRPRCLLKQLCSLGIMEKEAGRGELYKRETDN